MSMESAQLATFEDLVHEFEHYMDADNIHMAKVISDRSESLGYPKLLTETTACEWLTRERKVSQFDPEGPVHQLLAEVC